MESKIISITDRQKEVLGLFREGHIAKEIAIILGISLSTTKRHLLSIREKLGARNTTQAVVAAIREGCLDLERGLEGMNLRRRSPRLKVSDFCELCRHGVYDLSIHLQTEEHRRSLRKLSKPKKDWEPRLPVGNGIE